VRRERNIFLEECWTLVGARRGRVWLARRARPSVGRPASVAFDGAWVLDREERRGDVVGFLHTHPCGFPRPSLRDVRTMRAWCGAFGKPLMCVIASGRRVAAYRFDDDEAEAAAPAAVELFPRGVVIVVDDVLTGGDDDGDQQAASRGAVPRRGQGGEAARRPGRAVRRGRAGVQPRR
jgi:proteasome lid subunit RPN8/RPN11